MNVLFVDAGNYSRSPAALAVARALAAAGGRVDLRFDSAGLKDKHAGGPPDPRTVEVCQAAGYSLDGFVCRQITDDDYATQELILAMDRDNFSELVARRPAGASARIELFLVNDEVPDPYYGPADGFPKMLQRIEDGVRRLLERLPTSTGAWERLHPA